MSAPLTVIDAMYEMHVGHHVASRILSNNSVADVTVESFVATSKGRPSPWSAAPQVDRYLLEYDLATWAWGVAAVLLTCWQQWWLSGRQP